ncbi:ribonuclease H [Senna tora]|uniref:Ribonuclease H n=1 Tax=Senna tora TaxID=362788 RepID=A0A834WR64_9FABA|nr:ribonuclease H [Senna tora]
MRELHSVAKLPQNDPKIKNDQRCHIKWYPPRPGWIKLNVDGSHHNTTGSTACGGVACDEKGNWLFGFARRLGKRNVIYAEMWGTFNGVRIAKEKGYPRVTIEVDSKSALELIETESSSNQQLHTMIFVSPWVSQIFFPARLQADKKTREYWTFYWCDE